MSLLEIKKEIVGIDHIAAQSGVELKSPFYQAGTRCQGCSTFGCGAATTTLIVNSDFTISP
jgi:hypothetical protein